MVRRLFLVIALAVVILSLVGCQTVQGIGKDITSVGKAGEELLEKE
ncbi:MAG: Entericidin EcnA/B family protein [Planctomycetes bacterium RBG_16_55_9]|nr:MAG: Entericidin EcnA/B family protein [Planctomycetes bacterium RBG_16_55_9]